MQNGGFLDTRNPRPIGLIVIIAAHAAILTTIALSKADILPGITYLPTTLIDVPDTKAPPPPPPPAHEMKRETPTTIEHIVDTGPTPTQTIDLRPTPPIDIIPPTTLDPPKADPVFIPSAIDPRAQARFQPDYPVGLARAGVEGVATVRVLIGADGRVHKVELVNATDPAFFEATQAQALRFWRFKPATTDGTPTESWRTMTVRFRIQS